MSKESPADIEKLQNDANSLIGGFLNSDLNWVLRGTIKQHKYRSFTPEQEAKELLRQQKLKSHESSSTAAAANSVAAGIHQDVSNSSFYKPQASVSSSPDPNALRRTMSYSIASGPSSSTNDSSKSSGGFFSRIGLRFGSKKAKLQQQYVASPPPPAVFSPQVSTKPDAKFKTDPEIKTIRSIVSPSTSIALNKDASGSQNTLSRSMSTPNVASSDLDPRFEKFLQFYRNQKQNHNTSKSETLQLTEHNSLSKKENPDSTSTLHKSTVDSSSIVGPSASKNSKNSLVDSLGRPLPALPKNSSFRPAIKNFHSPPANNNLSPASTNNSLESNPATLIGGLLKRKSAAAPVTPNGSNSLVGVGSPVASDSMSINSNTSVNLDKAKDTILPGFDVSNIHDPHSHALADSPSHLAAPVDLSFPKRVHFSSNVFFNDPPQQIASREPRKGEVEIMQNGRKFVRKVTKEEKLKFLTSGNAGVVVGGTGHLKLISPEVKQREEMSPVTSNSMNCNADLKGDSEITDNGDSCIEGHVDGPACALKVNNLEVHQIHEEEAEKEDDDEEFDSGDDGEELTREINELMHHNVPLDVIYTRCCHLREILPIKSTMKQIPKRSTDPLPQLVFKNSMPSLIEIVTFCDFVSIVSVECVVFDGISMTFEMLKILLASLVYKKDLKKLSLRNTQLDENGWKLLCWFFLKNKSLSVLDITQCESLEVLPPKKSPKNNNNTLVRMSSNKNNRSDMDWSLFTASLIARGGIEDLILTGCKIPKLAIFEKLFKIGLSLKTKKIGIAYNDLTYKQMKIVCDWFYENYENISGIDLGYNRLDLGENEERSIENSFKLLTKTLHKITSNPKKHSVLKYFSMNSTAIFEIVKDEASLKTDSALQASSFIYNLSKIPTFQFLDISGNPQYFKSEDISNFVTFLPLLKNLTRLHLEFNELKGIPLMMVCEALLNCKSLYYLSLVGNELSEDDYVAVCNFVKNSHIISLDLDFETVPLHISSKLRIYTMRNMESVINKTSKNDDNVPTENEGEEDDDSTKKFTLSSLAEDILNFFEQYPDVKNLSSGGKANQVIRAKIFKFLIQVYDAKLKLTESIDNLIKLRNEHKLNIKGKEALIRFCFVDDSLENVLNIIKSKHPNTVKQFEEYYYASGSIKASDISTGGNIDSDNNIISNESSHKGESPYFDATESYNLPKVNSSESIANATTTTTSMIQQYRLHQLDDRTHRNDSEEDDEYDDNASFISKNEISKINKRSTLNVLLNKSKMEAEEANIMKAASKIRSRLVDEDGEPLHIPFESTPLIQFDSEKVREALLDPSKLGNIINVLDSLKASGVSLEDVFKKTDFTEKLKNDIQIKGIEAVDEVQQSMKKKDQTTEDETIDTKDPTKNKKGGTSSVSAKDEKMVLKSPENEKEGDNYETELSESESDDDAAEEILDKQQINKAYDTLVDDLVRVRSRPN